MKTILQFFFFLLILHNTVWACECPGFPPLSKDLFNTKDSKKIVFLGRVTKIGECTDVNTCTFNVKELFLGKAGEEIKAIYDCTGDCQMNFSPGEDWIIYADYYRVDAIKISFCSRSRKILQMNNPENEAIAFGCTIQEEIDFLRNKIGQKSITKIQETDLRQFAHKNTQPSPIGKVILLSVSMAVMILIILGSKKFLK